MVGRYVIIILLLNVRRFCLAQIVSTPSGYSFQGSYAIYNNTYVRSFLGIPYAEPPLGERRFRPSVLKEAPPGSNNTIINALNNPPNCLNQFGSGSEDCLMINIWAPESVEEGKEVPVMFYVHGGGFLYGSISDSRWNGASFAADNVVLVTVQFRNHWLGNFNLKPIFGRRKVCDQESNLALDDQRVALKWVKKNIASFGGDPDNITIFGHSSGAGFIMAHFASEKSKDLFHKAIVQSGSHIITGTLSYLTALRVLLQVLLPIERKYKCGDTSVFNINCVGKVGFRADLNWWQNAASDIMVEVMQEANKVIPDTIGSIITGPGFSVPDTPSRVLKNTDISSDKPLLIGITFDEGYQLYPTFSSYPGLNANLPDCGSWSPIVEITSPTIKATDIIIEDPTNTDIPGRRGNWTKEQAAFAIVDEILFGLPTQAMLEAHKGPTFSYIFENPVYTSSPCRGRGTTHGAEHNSIWGTFLSSNDMFETHYAWINFATTGDPGSLTIENKTVDWKEYDSNDDRFTMVISKQLRGRENSFGPERELITSYLLQECAILTPIGALFLRPVCAYNPLISFVLDIIKI